jgi:hypothetical protein
VTIMVLSLALSAFWMLLLQGNGAYAFPLEGRQFSLELPKRRSETPSPRTWCVSLLAGRTTAIAPKSSVSAGRKGAQGSTSYIQWENEENVWKMQTAVTTFRRGEERVELHAQLHFADKAYFQYWNSDDFNQGVDCVLFELLVDDDLLTLEGGAKRVKAPIMASINDQALASQYGWDCQASILGYTNPKWVHADFSQQEFVQLTKKDDQDQEEKDRTGPFSKSSLPLWKLASGPHASSAAAEAVSALLAGPPTLSYSTRYLKRRLFTNLFLPGSSFAFSLRSILWMTVPSPELSVILLDWSSLVQGGSNPSGLSRVALPILSSLLQFDIPQMRRFLFGQVLVSTSRDDPSRGSSSLEQVSAWSLLVTQRNDRALSVLRDTFKSDDIDRGGIPKSAALLYGSSHCPDLHSKLVGMGFTHTETTWRTAWSVNENQPNGTNLPALAAALLVFYLVIGALDWVGMMGGFAQSLLDTDPIEAALVASLYLLRHVLLYLGLSKFLVDWTNSNDDS